MQQHTDKFNDAGLLAAFSFALLLYYGCHKPARGGYPDCNCSPQKALIDEVSIHTLQTARFSRAKLIAYLRGKCLIMDTSHARWHGKGGIEQAFFVPVIICGVPGRLEAGGLIANFENGPIDAYGFTTNLNYVDSVSKELGISLPASITTNEALRDTFGRRINSFGGPENDSVALHWHGIFFDWFHGGIDVLINDSNAWAKDILKRDDKQTGPQ